ncbi:MAG: M16 family metallopeptidase [Bdellovibrionales bacterium]
MRHLILIFSLFFSLTAKAVTPQELEKAIQFPVEKYQLKNGLTVLLHPDSSIPSVSIQQWFRVGSKDEVVGRTGLAHFFEHMMFKGTKKFGKDTWGKFLNGKGAETNAFTSDDYTGYYINAPSENLELLMKIESDRMRNLLLDPKEVNSEREVVKEERRMRYDDNIEGGIREKMNDIMFTNLPYHWLPIGSMEDLNKASMEDLHKFYKTYYSPNNAVLVLAGAFKVEDAKKLVEEYYGGLPKEEIQRPVIKAEEPQTKEHRAVIEREAQTPTVAVGYRLPDLNSPDNYALDLLSIVLGQGESSRLWKQLVYKKEMALNVYAASWNQVLAGQFSLGASLKPKSDPEKALSLMEEQVKMVRDKTVSQKELDKARNLFMKEYVDGLKRISGRAHRLASYEILYGDYKRIFSDLQKYQEVTVEDLHRVAKLYLQPGQRNIVIVHPKKSGVPTT